jgi:hypothetical protein
LGEIFNSGKANSQAEQDLVIAERVLWLKTGGPKSLCEPVLCLGAKSNSDSTSLIYFPEPFLVNLSIFNSSAIILMPE